MRRALFLIAASMMVWLGACGGESADQAAATSSVGASGHAPATASPPTMPGARSEPTPIRIEAEPTSSVDPGGADERADATVGPDQPSGTPPAIVVPAPTPSPTAPAATSASDQQIGDAALEAHRGYFAALVASGRPPDPEHPELLRWSGGVALESAVLARRQMAAAGEYLDGAFELAPDVRSVSPDYVIVRDCLLDGVARHASDGGILVEPSGDRVLLETEVVRTSEGWRVESVATVAESCTP